ncbi:hypothetical protein EFM15_07425 [Lactobacillus delbrueckii]|nr:hypothetical protein [Lactobacillus delbrueckii]
MSCFDRSFRGVKKLCLRRGMRQAGSIEAKSAPGPGGNKLYTREDQQALQGLQNGVTSKIKPALF